jgi:hypothetical protein
MRGLAWFVLPEHRCVRPFLRPRNEKQSKSIT